MDLVFIFCAMLLIGAVIIAPLAVMIIGWGCEKSREIVATAAQELAKGNCEVAKRLLANAAVYNGGVRHSPEFETLNSFIAQNKRLSREECTWIEEAVANWPRTRTETIWAHPASKFVFFGVLVFAMLVKLLPLLGR